MPDSSMMKVAVVVSEWNKDITSGLCNGAYDTLVKEGVKPENIIVKWVPGSFELVYGARMVSEEKDVDAVIILGSVIKGETPHFNYVCQGVTEGITFLNVNGKKRIPYIFGLLTDNNKEQAEARSGGVLGNKGVEAAVTAIKMISFRKSL